jgi:hypothetical protein
MIGNTIVDSKRPRQFVCSVDRERQRRAWEIGRSKQERAGGRGQACSVACKALSFILSTMLSTLRTRSSALSRQTVFLTRTYATVEGKSTTVTSEQTSQTPATVTGESSVPATEANAATTAGTPVVPATPTAPTASVVPTVKPGTLTSGQPGALRPHLNIPVNPNHGLYAFFRQKEADDGSVWYETVEPGTRSITESGQCLKSILYHVCFVLICFDITLRTFMDCS